MKKFLKAAAIRAEIAAAKEAETKGANIITICDVAGVSERFDRSRSSCCNCK